MSKLNRESLKRTGICRACREFAIEIRATDSDRHLKQKHRIAGGLA